MNKKGSVTGIYPFTVPARALRRPTNRGRAVRAGSEIAAEACVNDKDGSVIVFPERTAPREAGAGVRRWAWPQGTIITQMLMDGGSTDRHGATGGHSAPTGFGRS